MLQLTRWSQSINVPPGGPLSFSSRLSFLSISKIFVALQLHELSAVSPSNWASAASTPIYSQEPLSPLGPALPTSPTRPGGPCIPSPRSPCVRNIYNLSLYFFMIVWQSFWSHNSTTNVQAKSHNIRIMIRKKLKIARNAHLGSSFTLLAFIFSKVGCNYTKNT